MPNNAIESIVLDGKAYTLEIKNFKTSKSIKLRVQGAKIVLTKSPRTPIAEALAFAHSNTAWLLEKLNQEAETLEKFLQSLGLICLHNKEYKLLLLPEQSTPSCIINHSKQEILIAYSDNNQLSKIILKIAKKELPLKAKSTAQSLGIALSKISIRSQRSLWGSRSTSGMLSLNWRILLLPNDLQNYIICHELAHIKFMDHSTSFWIYLNTLCPHAKKLDKLLGLQSSRIFKLLQE